VERYQQPLGGYLQHLVGDVDAALDLTQDTFVRAYRAIGATPPGLLVRPWLYRIATNLAHDHLRRRRRFAWLPLRVVDHFIGGHRMDAIEDRTLVRQALARLQPDERAVLLLCGLERLTYAEAAAALGGSAEAVRKRFSRAKARFRAAYGELAGAATP
jgi:RNA polymerase sigma-70 factor (ECF subfamily)